MVTKMDYITIDNFEGPLDLLLHLVKESNIDILDIYLYLHHNSVESESRKAVLIIKRAWSTKLNILLSQFKMAGVFCLK